MKENIYDPNMPIGEFAEACKRRLEELDLQLLLMQKERQQLFQFLNGYGMIQKNLQMRGVDNEKGSESRESAVKGLMGIMAGGSGQFGTPGVRSDSSNNETILAYVVNFLADGRKKTADLIERLNSIGLQLNSPNQQGLLSTLMSKDGRFVASRKLGWGLKGRDGAEDDPEDEELI